MLAHLTASGEAKVKVADSWVGAEFKIFRSDLAIMTFLLEGIYDRS